jgi:hypothetical protein
VYGGGREGRGRLLTIVMLLVTTSLLMAIAVGCGGTDSTAVISAATTVSSTPSETAVPATGGEGVQVAEKILVAFDDLVGEVAALAKDKPEPAVLKPQLEELYASSMARMTELNGEYLTLRDSAMSEFGECNIYLGEHRGQHVADKDNVLADVVRYYNFELGNQEMVSLLSERPVELLEVAVKQ